MAEETQNTPQFDPSVVALMHGLKSNEGANGNYEAVGDKGTAAGIGMWSNQPNGKPEPLSPGQIPYNFQTKAKDLGFDPSNFSPEGQNQVMYGTLEADKQSGLTPEQSLSKWNSGDPNKYSSSASAGNGPVGAYDVSSYVKNGMAVAQQYAQSQKSQAAPNPSAPDSSASSPFINSAQASTQSSQTPNEQIVNQGVDQGTDPTTGLAIGAGVLGAGGLAATLLTGGEDLLGGIGSGIKGGLQSLLGIKGITDAINNNPAGGSSGGTNQSTQPTDQPVTKSSSATTAVNDAINQMMQGSASNRVYSQSDQGKNAIGTAAAFGLINPDENGNLAYNADKGKQLLGNVSNLQDKIISANGGTNSPVVVMNHGGTFIGNDRLNTQTDKTKAAQIMRSEIMADSKGIPMNGQMSLADMRQAEKTHNIAAKPSYLNPRPNAEMLAHKALAHGYSEAIRDKMEDKGLYDKTKDMQKHLIQSREVGKRLNGKKPPKNKGAWESFMRQGARIAEVYIGDKLGGPIGAIIGGVVGEHLNNKLDRKFGRNIFETKGMKAAMDILRDTEPQIYTELVNHLEKQGTKIPSDITNKPPKGKPGLIKDINKDLNKIGQKGLVKLP